MTRATIQLYSMDVEVVFQAYPEDASDLAYAISGSLINHEAVWEVEADFDPDQKTETVDAA